MLNSNPESRVLRRRPSRHHRRLPRPAPRARPRILIWENQPWTEYLSYTCRRRIGKKILPRLVARRGVVLGSALERFGSRGPASTHVGQPAHPGGTSD